MLLTTDEKAETARQAFLSIAPATADYFREKLDYAGQDAIIAAMGDVARQVKRRWVRGQPCTVSLAMSLLVESANALQQELCASLSHLLLMEQWIKDLLHRCKQGVPDEAQGDGKVSGDNVQDSPIASFAILRSTAPHGQHREEVEDTSRVFDGKL